MEPLQPNAMLSQLRSAQLKIHEVSFGMGEYLYYCNFSISHAPKDLSPADNDESANTETVRIATLSNLFEELCEFYSLQSLRSHLDRRVIDSCCVIDILLVSKSLSRPNAFTPVAPQRNWHSCTLLIICSFRSAYAAR